MFLNAWNINAWGEKYCYILIQNNGYKLAILSKRCFWEQFYEIINLMLSISQDGKRLKSNQRRIWKQNQNKIVIWLHNAMAHPSAEAHSNCCIKTTWNNLGRTNTEKTISDANRTTGPEQPPNSLSTKKLGITLSSQDFPCALLP